MLSGVVLSQWLQRRAGTVVAGSSIRLSPSGLLRVSPTVDSHPVQVMLPVLHGGQAAVARVGLPGADGRPDPGRGLALRVQAISSHEERSHQMERLVAMLTVVEAARAAPATYPSVLPVLESFTLSVPGAEITTVGGPTGDYELWCDLVAWLPTTLASHHTSTGPTARDPSTVAAQIFPVLTTVRAVHDNLGIVHRDITPNNVLVSPDRRLVLSDWSLARTVATDVTSTQTLAVQPGLSLPPEMLAGDTSVGRYTDAWYLGSLLVWMLTGQSADPRGQPPEGLPPGPAGRRLATIAQGLCWPDPHQRMSLPEAVERFTQPVDAPWVPPTSHPNRSAAGPSGGLPGPQPSRTPPSDLPPRPPDRQNRSLRTTILAGIATLIVGVVVGVAWNVSHRNQPTATAAPSSAPSTSPTDEPYLFPSDEPTYPPFTGLNAMLVAFPLNPDDTPPECTRVTPDDYLPAGAQEIYRCVWSDVDATVFLSRWETASQGFDAWRKIADGAIIGDWNLLDDTDDGPRGSYLSWGETPSLHEVICYRDLPFCMEVLYPTEAELTIAEGRFSSLDASSAAIMVEHWPDISPWVTLPEPE